MTSDPPSKIELPPALVPEPSSIVDLGVSPLGAAEESGSSNQTEQPTNGNAPYPSLGRASFRKLGLGHASRGGSNLNVTPANRKQSTSSTRLRNRASRSSINSPSVGINSRRGSRATLGRNRDVTGLLSPGFDDGHTPKIPTLVPGIRPAYSTPLPVLPMVVLCIVSDVYSPC